MREVPVKNYIIVLVMTIGVVLLCFILRSMYKSNGERVYTSSIKELVHEINYDDLDNYLQENPDVILYIYDSSKKNNRNNEKSFKKLIVDNDISQYIVYIEKNKEISDKYDLNSSSPILIAYQNNVLTEVLSKKNINGEELESFLIRNKVIEK